MTNRIFAIATVLALAGAPLAFAQTGPIGAPSSNSSGGSSELAPGASGSMNAPGSENGMGSQQNTGALRPDTGNANGAGGMNGSGANPCPPPSYGSTSPGESSPGTNCGSATSPAPGGSSGHY